MAHTRSRKIDNLRWQDVAASFNALTAGSNAVLGLTATAMPDTIMRSRGTLLAYIDGTQAPGAQVRCAIGMIVVPEGTATTVLWSPLTDPNAPWFYFDVFSLGYEEGVTDVIGVQGAMSYRAVIDSKAMRKSPPDTEVQVVVEQLTTGSAMAINVQLNARLLIGN